MFISNLFLKLKYPFLRFFNLKKVGGIYSKNGQDIYILKYLFNFLTNNENIIFIELNKNSNEPFLVSNLFFKLFNIDFFYIDFKKKIIVKCFKNNNVVNSKFDNLDLGIDNAFLDKCNSSIFLNSNNLISSFDEFKNHFFNLIIYFDKQTIDFVYDLLENTEVKTIFVQNNKVYKNNMNHFRKNLFNFGFVFHSRLNGKDDFFIKSEMVNGFSSKMIKNYSLGSLNKWISEPPENDFTKPR